MTDSCALIYAINRTDAWWRHVGDHLGFSKSVVVTDIRSAGDCDVVSDFYEEVRRQSRASRPLILDDVEVADVIARCRLLRWLPKPLATKMVRGMEFAADRVLTRVKPDIVVSFPIDRYVSDVLERLAHKRGIAYVELTASLISGMSMLMYRGQLVSTGYEPSAGELEQRVKEIANPSFTPSYVQTSVRYTAARWLKTFAYFRLRGHVFKVISWLKRDPLNLHYLDAQAFLGHKPRLKDMQVLATFDWQWRDHLQRFPQERRVFFGLQLFPEASIDYWLANRELIDYEDLVLDAATAFSQAGWLVLVKDHPSQFGFRQHELIDRLRALPNVVLVPYDVTGNEVMSLVGCNFTLTGTLGLQAALNGLASVVSPTYYTTPDDFVLVRQRADVAGLPARLAQGHAVTDLAARQRRVLAHLMQGSFVGDFFSFRGFRRESPPASVAALARELGRCLKFVLRTRGKAHAGTTTTA